MIRDAVFSPDGRFRYRLTRTWAPELPRLLLVLLNPSTAGRELDDPTTRRAIGVAKRAGCGSVSIANLFAFVATDPEDLRQAGYPVGPANDDHLAAMIQDADLVVCGWGANAAGLARPGEVLAMIRRLGKVPHALKVTAGGFPAHPCRLPYGGDLVPL